MKISADFAQAWKTKITVVAGIAAAGVLTLAAAPRKPAPYLPLHVHVGEKAPDFKLASAEGGTVNLSQFAGHNVLLNFYEGYW